MSRLGVWLAIVWAQRFGEYPIDRLDRPPEAFDPHLDLLLAAVQAA